MAWAWGAKSLTRIDDQSPIVGTKSARCRTQTRAAAVARQRVATCLLHHRQLCPADPAAVRSGGGVCGRRIWSRGDRLHDRKLERGGGDDASGRLANHLGGGSVGVLDHEGLALVGVLA